MGLVLVELLTGISVVQTDHVMTGFRQHIRGSIEIPVALLESSLGPILCQSLHNDPNERFTNVSQFAQALLSINPESIPFGEELKEKIALNTYQKGMTLLDLSSEEESEKQEQVTEQHTQNRKIPLVLFAVIIIAVGIAIAMT